MPDEQKTSGKSGEKNRVQVFFTCQCCGQRKPIAQMRSVARFLPVLIVCSDCQKVLR